VNARPAPEFSYDLSLVAITATRTEGSERIASSTCAVPVTFVVNVVTGSSYDTRTSACAARCTTISGCAAVIAARSRGRSRTSSSSE
jgi:hypothetical protein